MCCFSTQPPSLVMAYCNSPHLAPDLADPARKRHFTVHPVFQLAYAQYRWLPSLVRTNSTPSLDSYFLTNYLSVQEPFKSHICFSFFKNFSLETLTEAFWKSYQGILSLLERVLIPLLERHKLSKRHVIFPNYMMFTQTINYCIPYYSFNSIVQYRHQTHRPYLFPDFPWHLHPPSVFLIGIAFSTLTCLGNNVYFPCRIYYAIFSNSFSKTDKWHLPKNQ